MKPGWIPTEPLIRAGGVCVAWSVLFVAFFSPVLASGRLLAPGDALAQYLPLFASGPSSWDPLLQGGWPLASDPQSLAWYPPAMLLRHCPHGWNAFVVSAYVVAASSMYALVLALTGSRFAGAVSGLVYGLGGCLVARLGHTVIVHAAAWIPLTLLAIDRMRFSRRPAWMLLGSVGVALTFLGGHPQVLAHALPVYVAWAILCARRAAPGDAHTTIAPAARPSLPVVPATPRGAASDGPSSLSSAGFLGRAAFSMACGLALAAIQIVPTAALATQTPRSAMGFEEFKSYALPVIQLPTLVFPWLFGGFPGGHPYFGEANMAELSAYVGLLPLVLAGLGFVGHPARPVAWFWGSVTLLGFLLALGDATPVAWWAYHVPGLNLFRCMGRHFVEYSVAIAVLAGLGVAAVEHALIRSRHVVAAGLAMAAALLAIIAGTLTEAGGISALSESRGAGPLSLHPLQGVEVGLPVALLAASLSALLLWARWRSSRLVRVLLFAVVLVDLSSCSWFLEWRHWAPRADIMVAPRFVEPLRDQLLASHQRMLPMRGVFGSPAQCPPNLSRLWNVPSLSGYTQLMLTTTRHFVAMGTDGCVNGGSRPTRDLSLDLMGVRYLFAPTREALTFGEAGFTWARDPLPCTAGTAPGQARSFSLRFPVPVRTTSLAVVSAMAGSASIPDGAEVACITVTDDRGKTSTCSLRAGRDTGEWALDHPDVRRVCRHRRPRVFESHRAERASPPFLGHDYLGLVALPGPTEVCALDVRWTAAAGSLDVRRLTLVQGEGGGAWPVSPLLAALGSSHRWRHVLSNHEASVYENTRVLPRAWMARGTMATPPDQALHAVISGSLRDGSPFDPRALALTDSQVDVAGPADPSARATVEHVEGGRMQVRTRGAFPAFLVTSDVYLAGWRAFVDGQETRVHRTDYLLRGVAVPAGEHVVQFVYDPPSLRIGIAVTLGAALLLAGTAWRGRSKAGRPTQDARPPDPHPTSETDGGASQHVLHRVSLEVRSLVVDGEDRILRRLEAHPGKE